MLIWRHFSGPGDLSLMFADGRKGRLISWWLPLMSGKFFSDPNSRQIAKINKFSSRDETSIYDFDRAFDLCCASA